MHFHRPVRPTTYFSNKVGIVTKNSIHRLLHPGVIGMTFSTTGLLEPSTPTQYRELKIIKKLATTPLSKIEWILGMVGYQIDPGHHITRRHPLLRLSIFGVTAT